MLKSAAICKHDGLDFLDWTFLDFTNCPCTAEAEGGAVTPLRRCLTAVLLVRVVAAVVGAIADLVQVHAAFAGALHGSGGTLVCCTLDWWTEDTQLVTASLVQPGVKHVRGGELTRQSAVQELQVVQRHVTPLALGALRVEAEPEAAGNVTQEDGVLPPASHAGGLGPPQNRLLGVLLQDRGPQGRRAQTLGSCSHTTSTQPARNQHTTATHQCVMSESSKALLVAQ